jgi:hypothetical protein
MFGAKLRNKTSFVVFTAKGFNFDELKEREPWESMQ